MEAVGILSDYIDRATLAVQLRCSERSIARYETQPDGLPSTMIGGRKFYKLESVRSWLNARECRPNPRRRAA